MKDNFQIILIFVFIVAAIFGLLVFSGTIPLGGDDGELGQGSVVLWGTFRAELVNSLLEEFNRENPTFVVQYVQKNPDTFDQDLLEALASGVGPDMFFLPDNLAFHYKNKIAAIPLQSYSSSSFKQGFAGAGEVFLTSQGILALPITIDPMVMYYSRDMLDANGVVYPPNDWTEFLAVVPVLTKKDDTGKIGKSAAAFGHYSNVSHAKDILSVLFMQLGNRIVKEDGGRFETDLGVSIGPDNLPNALRFYTDFADPGKSAYSWNKSFPLSRDFFSAGNLAFYFGYASELANLLNKNPNQNFQVAEIPQIVNSGFKSTGARVTGLAISAFSKNPNTAFIAAGKMTSGNFAARLAQNLGVVPARRDLLAQKPTDSFSPIFYASALYARSWLDPSPKDTNDIFRKMIESVLSGTLGPAEAVSDASAKMSLLLNR